MSAFNLAQLTRTELRAALSDAARKLVYVKDTVRNIPEAHIPFPRLQEILFLEQRVGEYKAELARRFTNSVPALLFYSYSRRDATLMTELNGHLSGMQNEGRIETFWDRDIRAGREWDSEIKEELKNADVVLLLVSESFLASRYCQQVELTAALEMHDQELVRAIPVILSPCEWQSTTLGRLQAIPRNGKPITEWMDREEAWSDVVAGIQLAINEIRIA